MVPFFEPQPLFIPSSENQEVYPPSSRSRVSGCPGPLKADHLLEALLDHCIHLKAIWGGGARFSKLGTPSGGWFAFRFRLKPSKPKGRDDFMFQAFLGALLGDENDRKVGLKPKDINPLPFQTVMFKINRLEIYSSASLQHTIQYVTNG